MDIEYFKEFVLLVELGSYTKAAEALFISQSSLSKHIIRMENKLGSPLLTRSASGVVPTEFGEEFLQIARSIVALQRKYTQLADARNKSGTESLRVVGMNAMYHYGVTDIISSFVSSNPGFQISVQAMSEPRICGMIRSDLCDLAIMREPYISGDDIKYHTIFNDHLSIMLPSSHPLAGRDAIDISELKSERFIYRTDPSSIIQQYTKRMCSEAGFEPKAVSTRLSMQFVQNMFLIKSGMGVAVAAKCSALYDIASQGMSDDIVAVDLLPYTPVNVCCAYKRCQRPKRSAQALIELLYTAGNQEK